MRLAAALLVLPATAAVAQVVVLHDNGGIVTAVGAAVDGSDLSAVAFDAGLSLAGHGAAIALGQRVADDFVVPADGWRIARFELLAYQQGAAVQAAPFDRVQLRVWDGEPDAPGSTVVFGTLAENRFTDVAPEGVYRVSGRATATQRPVFVVGASVGTLVLAAGDYWVEWQIGGGQDTAWAVPVSAAGQAPAGNARQFAKGWRALHDAATPQDLAFRIIGRDGDGGAQLPTLFIDGFED